MKILLISIICISGLTTFAQLEPVKTGAYHWADSPAKVVEDRESRTFLEGTSHHLDYIKIHATTQYPGAKPRPAHANKDAEELIIVKEGTMKVTIEGKSAILGAEGIALIMPQQMQSVENIGNSKLTYYAMQYKSNNPVNIARGIAGGGSIMLNADSLVFKPSEKGGGRPYFDRPTAMCERMEMHVTQLKKKGPSHNPHSHIEPEIILVISGETEMTIDGKEYKAGVGDFYFVNSELFHGLRNASDSSCTYFAFKWN